MALAQKPTARFVQPRESEAEGYARRANHLAIHTEFGDIVAVIEVVSPGNKTSRRALAAFAGQAQDLLERGVNLLVIDLLPPGALDPQGIHPVIWGDGAGDFALPPGEPLTVAAYQAGGGGTAYVEPTAVGQPVPPMPLFLAENDRHVLTPLAEAYEDAWAVQPEVIKRHMAG